MHRASRLLLSWDFLKKSTVQQWQMYYNAKLHQPIVHPAKSLSKKVLQWGLLTLPGPGLSSFWFVSFLVRVIFGSCSFWFVLFLVCALLGSCPFWFVLFLVGVIFGSCSFWFMLILVGALFGSCPFWFVPFLVGAVFVSCCFWLELF